MDPLDVSLDDMLPLDPAILPLSLPGVYAFVDAEGKLLYVGESQNVPMRYREHRSKSWAKEIRTILVWGCPDRGDRLACETMLILRHRPRHNRMIRVGLRKDGTLYSTQFVPDGPRG